jgi:hypothetical protein
MHWFNKIVTKVGNNMCFYRFHEKLTLKKMNVIIIQNQPRAGSLELVHMRMNLMKINNRLAPEQMHKIVKE